MVNKKNPCPLCLISYWNVSQHLAGFHKKYSSKGRKLISATISGRYNGPLDCPISGCFAEQLRRLDRHLITAHQASGDFLKTNLQKAKKELQSMQEENTRKQNESIGELKEMIMDLKRQIDSLSGKDTTEKAAGDQQKEPRGKLEDIIKQYKTLLLGVNKSRKKRENATQQLSHVRHFLNFISNERPAMNMKFLDNTQNVLNWIHLLREKFVITTCRHYMMDVVKFLQYLLDERPSQMRVKLSKIFSVQRLIRRQIKSFTEDITTHRQVVKAQKGKRILSRQALQELVAELKQRIPESLEDLFENPTDPDNVKRCMGYLGCYLFTISGHRTSVVFNMTAQEFKEAVEGDGKYVINIKAHKTASAFGHAKIALTAKEHKWFRRFYNLRSELPGYVRGTSFFFFNRGGNSLTKLGALVTDACHSCGIGDHVTVTDIRSAVATHIKRQLPKDKRKVVSNLMCHNEETASRFYVAEMDVEETHAARHALELALGLSKAPRKKRIEGSVNQGTSNIGSNADDDQRSVGKGSMEELPEGNECDPRPASSHSDNTNIEGPEENQEDVGPSPLSKRVKGPSLGSKKSQTRRKLVYPQRFKKKVKAAFGHLFNETIMTDDIHTVLAANPDLLKTCKSMDLTVDNLSSLVKKLQNEKEEDGEEC